MVSGAVVLDLVSNSWGLPMYVFIFFILTFQLALIFLTPKDKYLTIAGLHFLASLVGAGVSGWLIDFGMGPGFGSSDSADFLFPAVKYIGVGSIILLGIVHLVIAIKIAEK